MWESFLGAIPFVFVTGTAAGAFHLYWNAAVERSDDDTLTKTTSFLLFLALSLIVLWVRQPR